MRLVDFLVSISFKWCSSFLFFSKANCRIFDLILDSLFRILDLQLNSAETCFSSKDSLLQTANEVRNSIKPVAQKE